MFSIFFYKQSRLSGSGRTVLDCVVDDVDERFTEQNGINLGFYGRSPIHDGRLMRSSASTTRCLASYRERDPSTLLTLDSLAYRHGDYLPNGLRHMNLPVVRQHGICFDRAMRLPRSRRFYRRCVTSLQSC
jgi:hypothetical protein